MYQVKTATQMMMMMIRLQDKWKQHVHFSIEYKNFIHIKIFDRNMEEEVDIFLAQLVRENKQQAWGFRLEGGYDTHAPLRIALVSRLFILY